MVAGQMGTTDLARGALARVGGNWHQLLAALVLAVLDLADATREQARMHRRMGEDEDF